MTALPSSDGLYASDRSPSDAPSRNDAHRSPELRSRPGEVAPSGPFSRVGRGRWGDQASLFEVQSGQVVRVEGILFEVVRNRCWELGVVEGAVFECVGREEEAIVLADADDREVRVPPHVARFVAASVLSTAA